MNKNFIQCLDNIIDIEKSALIQQKLLSALDKKIKSLGIPKNIPIPQKQETYFPNVQYNVEKYHDAGNYAPYIIVGAPIVAGVIGILRHMSSSDEFILFRLLSAAVEGVIWAIGGIVVGFLIAWLIPTLIDSSTTRRNEASRKEAEAKAQELYNEQFAQNERQYEYDLQKYHKIVDFDKRRVIEEKKQKEELIAVRKALLEKHNETKTVLEKFYNAADIYVTYRNIVAMCYICEYLKSGICTELTGPNGAFMVFKYEMYEKMKIEKLDTIASHLEQLHFDNQILNSTLKQVGCKVDDLIYEVGDMKAAQIESAQRNEQLMQNMGGQIASYANSVNQQNAIIAYNTECAANEANQIKWLALFNSL